MKEKLFCPTVPRCGAHARTTGQPCKKVAMANGRCMNHGGKSLKGKASTRYRHGLRSKEMIERGREIRRLGKTLDALINNLLR